MLCIQTPNIIYVLSEAARNSCLVLFVQLLVRLVTSYRYNGEDVDEVLARSEAAKLHDAISNKQPHHEEVVRILGTRSKSHLKATFKHYKQDYGKTIDEVLFL